MSEVEKTFVIPEPTTPLTKELDTRMHPLSLAIAKETGQLDTVASELQSAFVEIKPPLPDKHEAYNLSSPRSIKEVLADEEAPQSLKDGISQMLQDLKDGKIHLS